MPTLPRLLPLTPQFRERVWGGELLHPSSSGTPIGEAWIAYGESVVTAGLRAGRTVDDLLREDRAALLGTRGAAQGGFPLLIKLLDCADWLSVQVHPNDRQAESMVGPGERGKTEAWHMLRAVPDAEILAGVQDGTTRDALAHAIRSGSVLDVAERHRVEAGDTVFIPAGTLHALGPGLLLYEVQQSSDTTYRVYDWDRPASAGRALHLEESVAVTDPALHGDLRPASVTHGQGILTSSAYFELTGLHLTAGQAYTGDTAGQSVQIVTVTEGEADLVSGDERLTLPQYATALVTGVAGTFTLTATGDTRVLISALPE